MSSMKWEFPHPLLASGRDDYSVGRFSLVEGNHRTTNDSFVFSFKYDLDCPGLEEYIKNGNADVILKASSSAAKYRDQFVFLHGKNTVEVPIIKNSIVKNVEFTAIIVAHGDEAFCLPEHNEEYYKGASFSLRRGDILAFSDTIIIPIDDSQLQKPIASIFEIREDTRKIPKDNDATFDGEKIVVFLSPESYKRYDLLKKRHPHIRRALSAIVTLPALAEAIDRMRCEEYAQYEKLRWYNSIVVKLAKMGIDFSSEEAENYSATELANMIYGNIVSDALNAIQTVLDRAIDPSFQELGGID